MRIGEVPFRDIMGKMLLVESNLSGNIEQLFQLAASDSMDNLLSDEISLDDLPAVNNVNSLLVSPYIDHQAGISFLVLATSYTDDEIAINERADSFSVFSTLRKNELNDAEFIYIDSNELMDLTIYEEYATETLKGQGSDDLNLIRSIVDIDVYRDDTFFDDVQVLLASDDLKPEIVRIRSEKILDDNLFAGVLLNEPYEDFGVHQGDIVRFVNVHEDELPYHLIALLD